MSGCKRKDLRSFQEIVPKSIKSVNITMVEDPEAEGEVMNQIILSPQIMSRILKNLDLRDLKQARLVCKSWLREARVHMEKRGIVRFCGNFYPTRIEEFCETLQQELPALPQPCLSIDVELSHTYGQPTCQLLFGRLSTLLSPPLILTRFFAWRTPLSLALPLIIRSSSSLEVLQLMAEYNYGVGNLPPVDPNLSFPKLRSLEVDATFSDERLDPGRENDYIENIVNTRTRFPAIVAWIVKASPNLEVYKARDETDENVWREASGDLLRTDIKNVKALRLSLRSVGAAALEHFLAIPFDQLKELSVAITVGPYDDLSEGALATTMGRSVDTLKILNLSSIRNGLSSFDLPVCPYVQELTLAAFPDSKNFLVTRFPSLQILNVSRVREPEDFCRQMTPLLRLKTLRIRSFHDVVTIVDLDVKNEGRLELEFFGNFPALERLFLPFPLLNRVCVLKATGDPKFLSLLQGVKHLELTGERDQRSSPSDRNVADYSLIHVLQGVESITMIRFNSAITSVPIKDLPCLKSFKFPWGPNFDLDYEKLLALARSVEKVIISNCCSIPRVGNARSKDLLKIFFNLTPNAKCGCVGRRGRKEWLLD